MTTVLMVVRGLRLRVGALRSVVFVAVLASFFSLDGCSVYDGDALKTSAKSQRASASGATTDSAARSGNPDGTTAADRDGSMSASTSGSSSSGSTQACERGECWWSHDLPDSCRSSGAPSASDRPNDSGLSNATQSKDLYLAWYRTRLGEPSRDGTGKNLTWQQYGFDLDDTCTNTASCPGVQDAQSCRASTPRIPFDGELCRDNSFGSLFAIAAAMPEIGERFGLSDARINCELWRGQFSIVMRLSGYNGTADDSKVRLDVYAASGLQTLPPWKCPLADYETLYPHWRQAQPWHIDSASLSAEITKAGQLPDAIAHVDDAYVKNGYLVAAFPDDMLLRLLGDGQSYRGLALTLHRSIWTGKLTRSQDSTWEISDGLIGGRIRKQDFVRSFRELGLCDGPLYNDLLGYIEERVDIVADGQSDPGRDCDAISFGIGFEAAAMSPGAAATVPQRVECCLPERPLAECSASCGDGRLSGNELCDTALAKDSAGACPSSCPSEDACVKRSLSGSQCMQACVSMPISEVGAADSCCPSGANQTVDKDCPSVCGNSVVEANETCDPPESCAACSSSDACLVPRSSGSMQACNSRCELTKKSDCSNGDGCCPDGCNPMNDNDCSSSCGNNTLDANETCERNAEPRCPGDCDDGDVCTQDIQTGSAASCNVRCTYLKVTQPKAGDGCCPPGANASSDSDCTAACGNGKLEGDEQCDDGNTRAGDGCTVRCTQETAQERCTANWHPPSEDCAQCACSQCPSEIVACINAADEAARSACTKVVECAARERCYGQDCYCGSVDAAECLAVGSANGKCREVIEQVTGTNVPATIRAISLDPTTPLGLAFTQRFCIDTLCRMCSSN